MKIEIVSGSPRVESVTRRVALHLLQRLRYNDDVEVGLINVRKFILPPVENVIASPDKAPDHLQPLATRIFEANAFILVTPEYNGGYSPAMKNLFDHFPKQNHKVFGIVAASPGAMGGIRAALAVQHLVYGLFGIGSPHMLIVPEVDKKFAPDGTLNDGSFEHQINQFVRELLWLTRNVALTEATA
jgi:NAD(P)H-dependent FMN reductase